MSTIAIVQCRLGSSRFKNKALADLCGRPVIRHVVERALLIQGVDRVIVATPSIGESMQIAPVLPEDERLSVFTAALDENDVLGRFVAALESYPDCDTVMRLTGDCPLIDQSVCEAVLRLYRSANDRAAYAWTDTHSGVWPDGLDVECFSRTALQAAHEVCVEPENREHVTLAIRKAAKVLSLPAGDAFAHYPKVSIDTKEDLDVVRQMIVDGRVA
jgi:spore coat polysaccharide biosynthesis protein SpsF (cytidylyltransferase family)